MKKFIIDMKQPMPTYLRNWAAAHDLIGSSDWRRVEELFQTTTNGRMVGVVGEYAYNLVFDDDTTATWFILRWS
jgi:hypothetical protein